MPSETVAAAVDTVNVANVKTVAETPAWCVSMAMQQHVLSMGRLNILAEQLIGAACKRIVEVDPTEAVSVLKTLTGNDMGQQLSALMAALASGQEGAKMAQTTPPPTA